MRPAGSVPSRSLMSGMSDQWNEDQSATTAASRGLPDRFVILWDRDEGVFGASLYERLSGAAVAETAGEREVVLWGLVETARELATNPGIDLSGLPPGEDRYTISAEGRAITCWTCGRTSYHPKDVLHRYCGACRAFHA